MREPIERIRQAARDEARPPPTSTRWVNATTVGLLTAAMAYVIGLGGNYDPLILTDAGFALIAGLSGGAFEFFRHGLKRRYDRASPQRLAGELALISAVAIAMIGLHALLTS